MTHWKAFLILAFLIISLSVSGGQPAFCFSSAGFEIPAPLYQPEALISLKQPRLKLEISLSDEPQMSLDHWLGVAQVFARAA